MKLIIGIIMIVLGIALGLYVGVWLCFIGGIVQIIEQVRAENLEAIKVAFGVLRIIIAGACGVFSALVLIIPGIATIQKS